MWGNPPLLGHVPAGFCSFFIFGRWGAPLIVPIRLRVRDLLLALLCSAHVATGIWYSQRMVITAYGVEARCANERLW